MYICICMCICICVYMYMCIYIYIHVYYWCQSRRPVPYNMYNDYNTVIIYYNDETVSTSLWSRPSSPCPCRRPPRRAGVPPP